jgi:hypothetical protein
MKKAPWTSKEVGILQYKYFLLEMKEIVKLLPGRSENAIYKKVAELKRKGYFFEYPVKD